MGDVFFHREPDTLLPSARLLLAGCHGGSQNADEAVDIAERVVEWRRGHAQHTGFPHVTLEPRSGVQVSHGGKNRTHVKMEYVGQPGVPLAVYE